MRSKKPNNKYNQVQPEPPKSIKDKKQEKQEQQKEILKKKIEKKQTDVIKEKEDEVQVILSKKAEKHKKLDGLFIPNDDISKDINKSLIKLKVLFDKFKVNFPDSLKNGTQVLEVKPQDYKQPKVILFGKLQKGEYHTPDSNSDITNISKKISLITKKFPSFQKYKDVDNLDWIIKDHRKLFNEIIEWITSRDLAPSNLKSFITVIQRIFRLGYNSKSTPLYTKYTILSEDLSEKLCNTEEKNTLSEIEKTKYLEWEHIMITRNKLEHEFNSLTNKEKGFKLNQALILVSLYTLTPVLRREVSSLKFATKKPEDKKGDYVYFHKKGGVSLELYEEKKKHGYISIPLNYRVEDKPIEISKMILKYQTRLARLLKESYEFYKRECVFININRYSKGIEECIKPKAIAERLNKIFSGYGVNVGASSLRSAYYTYLNELYLSQNTQLTQEEKELVAHLMRTSVKMLDENYKKIFRQSNKEIKEIPLDAIVFDSNDNIIKVEKETTPSLYGSLLSKPKECVEKEQFEEEAPKVEDRLPQQTKLVKTAYERQKERVNQSYAIKKLKEIDVRGVDGNVRKTTEAAEYKRLMYHKKTQDDKYAINRQRILREYHNGKRTITKGSMDKYKFTEGELKK